MYIFYPILSNQGVTKGWTNAKCLLECLFHGGSERDGINSSYSNVTGLAHHIIHLVCRTVHMFKKLCMFWFRSNLSFSQSIQPTHTQISIFPFKGDAWERKRQREWVRKWNSILAMFQCDNICKFWNYLTFSEEPIKQSLNNLKLCLTLTVCFSHISVFFFIFFPICLITLVVHF